MYAPFDVHVCNTNDFVLHEPPFHATQRRHDERHRHFE